MDWILKLAATQGFLPHGYCFQWSPGLLGMMVGSDAVITASYYSIPVTLMAFMRVRKDIPFTWVFFLFAAFIFLCGTTHLAHVVTIWIPAYWLQAYAKLGTAIVSLATAIALWVLMPRLLRLPSSQQLRTMVERLEHEVAERRAAQTRLDELNHDLERRVQLRTQELEESLRERERLWDVERARQVAEEANRAKSDFLSSMSHELRTPLNAVIGFSHLMIVAGQNGELSAQHLKWAQHTLQSGTYLLSLIEDVLDFARIEARGVELQLGPAHLQQIVTECAAMVQGDAATREVSLHIELQPPEPVLFSDARRIRQVLMNLLTNAIKYNVPGGRVDASVHVKGEELLIRVGDTGLGMDEAQLSQLFIPFNRLGREKAAVQQGGSGLGLVITQQVVASLGGRMSVSSSPGRGTEFVVVVPCTQGGAPVAPRLAPA